MIRCRHVICVASFALGIMAEASADGWDWDASARARLEAYATDGEDAPGRWRGEAAIAGEVRRAGTIEAIVRAELREDTAGWIEDEVLLDLLERRESNAPLSVPEAYLHGSWGSWDVRLGKILYGWGSADGWNPTDNLNPRDYTDPLRADKLGVVSGHVLWQRGDLGLELVVLPFVPASRLPGTDSRFGLPIPDEVGNPFYPQGPPTLDLQVELAGRRLPGPSWDTLGSAFRATWKLPGSQVAATYQRLVGDLPVFEPVVGIPDLESGTLPVTLAQSFHREEVVGIDFQTAVRDFGLRAESARIVSRDDRAGDDLVAVFGVDRRFADVAGEQDLTIIASFVSQRTLRAPESPLPADASLNPERPFERGVLIHAIWEIRDGLAVDLSAFTAFGDGEYEDLLVSYRPVDRLKLEAKIERVAGPRGSYLGAYQDDGRLWLQVAWSF